MKKITGFNLIELMLTLSIIGILCMMGLPVYSQHLIHAKRLEAEMDLIKLANALEKYFLLNNTYEKATLGQLNIPEKTADNQYKLQIVSVSNSDYLIQALPLDQQIEKDKICGTLRLDSAGNKAITGSGSLVNCWS